jgi:NAD(P) transhydrogenase
MSDFRFDLLVIGAGTAGRQAALQGAASGKRVALVEKRPVFATRSSLQEHSESAVRRALLESANSCSNSPSGTERLTSAAIIRKASDGLRAECRDLCRKLSVNKIETLEGTASFVQPHTIRLDYAFGGCHAAVTAHEIVIATGTEAAHTRHVPFDGRDILLSNDILALEKLPRSLAVVGAGRTGRECAIIFAAQGVRVTLIERQPTLVSLPDQRWNAVFAEYVRTHRIALRLDEEVCSVEPFVNEHGRRVLTTTRKGRHIVTEKLLYAIERTGATKHLNLAAVGIATTARGHIAVDEHSRTTLPHVLAAGSVAHPRINSPSHPATNASQPIQIRSVLI